MRVHAADLLFDEMDMGTANQLVDKWCTFVDGCCSRFRSGSRDASSRLSGPGDVDVTYTSVQWELAVRLH
jgi:hypothetical protein